jgi:hypothetical protein
MGPATCCPTAGAQNTVGRLVFAARAETCRHQAELSRDIFCINVGSTGIKPRPFNGRLRSQRLRGAHGSPATGLCLAIDQVDNNQGKPVEP